MSISSVPSSTFTRPAYAKLDNNNRRSSSEVEHSQNSHHTPLKNDSIHQHPSAAKHTINQDAGGFNSNLPQFEKLADVLATHSAVQSDTDETKEANDQLHQTTEGFESRFANSAQDKDAFHSLMQTAFGDNYDQKAAENIRQHTLAGDFSWMPDIKVVDGTSLADTSGTQRSKGSKSGLAAYDSESDTIYLSKALLAGDPKKAADVLTEEVGHAIDARVNTSDSAGDEGELFSKLVGGEKLSAAQIQALRTENDHGTIEIDGKAIEVEYFKLPSLSDIGNALSSGAQAVGKVVNSGLGAIVNGAQAIGGAVSNAFSNAVSNRVKSVGGALSHGISSIGNFFSDGINWVGDTVTGGFDYVSNNIVSPILKHVPVVGPWLNNHLVHPGFGLLETAVNMVTNTVDSVIDFGTHALSGAVNIGTNLLAGDFQGAWNSIVDTAQTLGSDVAGFAIESVLIPAKGIATAINKAFNLTEYRGLRPEEQAYLETIYSDSIDYDKIRIQQGGGVESMLNLDAHALGNNIFIPDQYFNADGSLTTSGKNSGLDLLAHEVAHVWQFQTGGASYIGDAALSYSQSYIEQGDRNGAYDFTTAIEQMKPWDDMTPDEQAEIAMVIGEALENSMYGGLEERPLEQAIDNHNGRNRAKIELSQAHINYLMDIHNILQAG